MMNRKVLAAMFSFFVTVLSLPAIAIATDEGEHYTYVLIHGATGGGWDWKVVDRLLTTDNHVVYRPTLTGLGEKVHLANSDINLSTHIDDVVNLILFENLDNVILVGHSYGGMIHPGNAQRIAGGRYSR